MLSFTLIDALGIVKACLALLPFIVAPGYLVGWALDLFEFRQRRPLLRLILSVPLSSAICPMLSYLLARFLEPGLWVFYLGAFAGCAALIFKQARGAKPQSLTKCTWVALGLLALWGIAVLGSLVDLQIGDRLYPSFVGYDHSARAAITGALARHVPPNNPFFANSAAPLSYHYLWLLFCSLPMKVLHLSPRLVVYSGIVWCGVALMCTVALGFKFFLRVPRDVERTTLLGVGLLSVTGLDLLPTLYLGGVWRLWQPDMEKWNEPQITSWAGSLLWVPHHVAALIACFVAFVLLRHQSESHGRWSAAHMVVAGMGFASAAGMSVYVTFTFAVAVVLWLLALISRKNWVEVRMFAGAGVVALLWALPFLHGLRGSGAGGPFAEFALRPFPLGIVTARQLGIALREKSDLFIANALFLPINYALELGFFLAVAIFRGRQIRRGRMEAGANELASWTLVIASFVIGTFVRSSSTTTNDLGWRCFLPAQLVLALWGTMLLCDWRHSSYAGEDRFPSAWVRGGLVSLLVLGMLGTAYQVFMLRMFPILSDKGVIAAQSWIDPDRQFGKRAYAFRSAYEALAAQLPASAIVQSNPGSPDRILDVLYSGHDASVATAAGDPPCGIAFGADPRLCGQRLRSLAGLFEVPEGNPADICRENGIDAVVVESSDPLWAEPSFWIWSQRPVVANEYARAFLCRTLGDYDRGAQK